MSSASYEPGVHTVIGVDAGSANLGQADHLLHGLSDALGLPADVVACTHLIRTGDRPHVAASLALPDAETARTVWHRLTALLANEHEPSTGAAFGDLRHGPADPANSAAEAAGEHARRTGGRAVLYPGVQRLTGTVPMSLLLDGTAIDRVTILGAPTDTDPDSQVLTRDHVRPNWQNGTLVLPLTSAANALLAPFEVPHPTPCCADHTTS